MFTLPYGPEPANVLAPLLGGVIGGIGEGFQSAKTQSKTEDAFNQLVNAESPIDQFRAVMQMPGTSTDKSAILEFLSQNTKQSQKEEQAALLDENLAKLGMPKALRSAIRQLNPGSQTELIRSWVDNAQRKGLGIFADDEFKEVPTRGKSFPLGEKENITEIGEVGKTNVEDFGDIADIETKDILSIEPPNAKEVKDVQQYDEKTEADTKFDFPILPKEIGITEKERVQREKDREKTNSQSLAKEREKRRNLEGIDLRINRLDKINKSLKLPDNPLVRLLSGTNAGLKLLQTFGNPETQSFLKTIQDFTVTAKDSFGARVTNFEIQAFLKRLPQLINTPEGRNLIIEQMKLVNEADLLESDAMINTIQHYGAKNISPDQASKIADNIIRKKKEELRNKMDNLDQASEKTWNKLSKKNPPKREVTLRKADRTIKVKPENVEEFIQFGWEGVE